MNAPLAVHGWLLPLFHAQQPLPPGTRHRQAPGNGSQLPNALAVRNKKKEKKKKVFAEWV